MNTKSLTALAIYSRDFWRFLPLLTATLYQIGCTWVETDEQASFIQLIESHQAQACEQLGTTTSSVKDQIGWFNRSEEKVSTELVTLAKNASVALGANSISAAGPVENGSQTFIAYLCP